MSSPEMPSRKSCTTSNRSKLRQAANDLAHVMWVGVCGGAVLVAIVLCASWSYLAWSVQGWWQEHYGKDET